MVKKRGQQKLSFGMIFSIILIIIFISFAVWGIYEVIKWQREIQIEKFPSDLQDDVTEVWKSTHAKETFSYDLPDNIVKVCFVKSEYGNKNLELIEKKEGLDKNLGKYEIDHVDINSTVKEKKNEFCVENVDGSVNIVLEKEAGEKLVTIKKNNI